MLFNHAKQSSDFAGGQLITALQATKACILCQDLSKGYIPIHLFRYDSVGRYIFILAGETIEIQIFENGNWRFINE